MVDYWPFTSRNRQNETVHDEYYVHHQFMSAIVLNAKWMIDERFSNMDRKLGTKFWSFLVFTSGERYPGMTKSTSMARMFNEKFETF
jgi:hypothetical protein